MDPEPVKGLAPELRRAWYFAVLQNLAIVGTLIALGNKQLHLHAAAYATLIFWAAFGFIVFLRRSKPILLDLLFVRWGFPLLWLAILIILVQLAKARVT